MENIDSTQRAALLRITALCSEYCLELEQASSAQRDDFIREVLGLLPKIYSEFLDLELPEPAADDDSVFLPTYVDEDYYESIRMHLANLLGPDDAFLETFEEDMKYSDTPIASSISECLADIFQPLYNFVSAVRESGGDSLEMAYRECRENFAAYWARVLCNVLRALNALLFT